jgi:hypothetical protein
VTTLSSPSPAIFSLPSPVSLPAKDGKVLVAPDYTVAAAVSVVVLTKKSEVETDGEFS